MRLHADKDELKDYLSHIQNEKEYHMEKVKRDFCINCRKEIDIVWGKVERTTNIKGKPFNYLETVAVCKECGQEMNPHGLIKQGRNMLCFFICENILKQNNIIFIIKILHCA